jgi:hypothetical protein
MSKHKKIKANIPLNQGKNVKLQSTTEMPDFDYPIFCFKHLHKEHDLEKCDDSEKKSLMEKIVTLSQLSWSNIQVAPKHGLGSEKINIKSIKPSRPSFITDDVTFLLAVRFQGKKPMIGHRHKFVFHIIYIDRDFTVYNH